jgi:succinate dehydrogenase/fumarate reductase flavoprotein subunit
MGRRSVSRRWVSRAQESRSTRTDNVLDESSNAIEGLYAAGECTAGIIASYYVNAGNCIALGLVFRASAGRSAAKHALEGATLTS